MRNPLIELKVWAGELRQKLLRQAFRTQASRQVARSLMMPRLAARPRAVLVELTNACNADCIMCPRPRMDRRVGPMRFSLFQKIVDECGEWGVPKMYPVGYGETLLLPHLERYLDYIRSHSRMKVQLNTNGSLLRGKRAQLLLEQECVESLFVTIDGATKETFEKVRKHLVYEQVVRNVRDFLALRNAANKRRPLVFVGMIGGMEESREETSEFLSQWRGVADVAYIAGFSRRGGSVGPQEGWSGPVPHRRPCFRIWSALVILNNGDVALCCDDWNGEVILGNASQQSLQEIWNSAQLRNIRELHLRGAGARIPLCYECNFENWDTDIPAWWYRDAQESLRWRGHWKAEPRLSRVAGPPG